MPEAILPSWNDTATKQHILSYVQRVTDPSNTAFTPLPLRIAAFDHDGTLWCEKPMYTQMAYMLDDLRQRAEATPALSEIAAIKARVLDNLAAIRSVSMAQFLDTVTTIYHGPLPAEYEADLLEWLARARHPRFGVPYTQLVYQPMLELMDYLRRNEFKIIICSGGGIDFVRVISDLVYGVPRECVIGTAINHQLREHDGRLALERETSLHGPINEGPGKPANIQVHIGRQPTIAIGNSTGDIDMLRMTQAGEAPSLCLMVNHDDAQREYAYVGKSTTVKTKHNPALVARRKGWTVVSMKDDWSRIFRFP